MSDQLFSEKEATEILQQAAKMQEAGGGEDRPYRAGVSKEELIKIAKEAGIDSSFVDLAIQKGASAEALGRKVPESMNHERIIDGELPAEHFGILLEDIRPYSSGYGTPVVTQIGNTLDTTTWAGTTQARVTVSSRHGRTRLNVRTDSTGAWLMSGLPLFIFGLVALIPAFKVGGPIVGVGTLAGLAAVGVGSFRALLRAGHKAGAALADKLAAKISEETRELRERLAAPTTQNNEAEETPRVHLESQS